MITISIYGASEVTELLRDASESAGDISILTAGDGDDQLRLALGRCAQRTINRQDYTPLDKRYEKAKIRRVGRKKILERSQGPANLIGLLAAGRSFTLRPDAGGKRIEISLNDPLAVYHQIGAGDLPERHVIESDQQLADDIGGLLNEKLREKLAKKLKKR